MYVSYLPTLSLKLSFLFSSLSHAGILSFSTHDYTQSNLYWLTMSAGRALHRSRISAYQEQSYPFYPLQWLHSCRHRTALYKNSKVQAMCHLALWATHLHAIRQVQRGQG